MKQRILIVLCSLLLATCYGQDVVTVLNGNSGLDSIIFENIQNYSGFRFPGIEKTPVLYTIIRSTMGVSGLSKTILTSKGSYIVSQSIGQSSVIGTFNNNGYTVSQGFQQPFISARIVQPPTENNLKVTLYPNPFRRSINISFDDPITNDIFVILSDMMGRIIFSQKFPASQLIYMPLAYIPDGIYIIKINTENKVFISNIIKQ
jgi:hypothetical protein